MAQRICRLGVAALVASLACLAFASSALANFHLMGIREVKPSSSNSANDGYVELQMYQAGQELVQNHLVSIYSASTGASTETFTVPDNVANGDLNATIVIGESNVAQRDFTDDQLNIPAAGAAACWDEASPPDCVSWGNFSMVADMALQTMPGTTAGTPASPLGVTAGKSLRRDITANCPHLYEAADDTNDSAADFDEVTPNPRPNSVTPTETECVPPDTLIDTTPDSTPPFAVNSTSANFTFHASPASGATFSCKLDNNAPEACNGGSKGYTSLSEGSHTFQVTASNSDGADLSPATYTWTVDTSPPDTSIDSGPTEGSTVASTSASFGFSGGSTFECKLDSGSFASCSSPQNLTSLGQGSHTFSVRAIDDAGNVDASPASRTWTVDTVPPDTQIDTGPTEGSSVSSTSASFTFSSAGGGTGFECKLDTAAFAPCTSPQNLTLLGQGSHTFQVRAKDAVGNTDQTPATRTWTVDTAAPDTTIDTQPSNPTASTSASFTFHSSETNSTFQCRLDSSLPGDFTSCTSPKNYAGPLGESSHTFEVRAIDAAGNPDGSPASYTWTVNSAAPPETDIDTTPDSTPPFAVSSTSANFTFHATPATGATFQCRLDSSLPGDFASCTSPKNYAGPLTEGQHTFDVRATGPGGTDATPSSYTWTVDTTAPNTSINGGPAQGSSINATSASFPFSSPDGGTSFQCRLDSSLPGDFTSCTSPKSYAGPLNEGPHTFDVRAIDDAGNTDSTPASRGWTIDLTPPVTTIDTNPTDPTTSTTAPFTYHSGEPTGATFKCKLDAEVDFTSCPSSGKTYNGLGLGEHTFTVRAFDAAGNEDTTGDAFSWEIQAPPAPPNTVITKAPKRKSKDRTPTTSFVSEPADGATFQCQVDSAAYKDCTSPYTTKKLKPGKHTIRVKAKRQGVEDPTPASASFKILR